MLFFIHLRVIASTKEISMSLEEKASSKGKKGRWRRKRERGIKETKLKQKRRQKKEDPPEIIGQVPSSPGTQALQKRMLMQKKKQEGGKKNKDPPGQQEFFGGPCPERTRDVSSR